MRNIAMLIMMKGGSSLTLDRIRASLPLPVDCGS